MNKQTLEHMKQLRLYGMYRAFDSSLSPQSINYTNDELIAPLTNVEHNTSKIPVIQVMPGLLSRHIHTAFTKGLSVNQ